MQLPMEYTTQLVGVIGICALLIWKLVNNLLCIFHKLARNSYCEVCTKFSTYRNPYGLRACSKTTGPHYLKISVAEISWAFDAQLKYSVTYSWRAVTYSWRPSPPIKYQ